MENTINLFKTARGISNHTFIPKTKWEKKEQIKKLIRVINSRITDIKILKGGFIMTDKVLLLVFKEHTQLKNEWDILHNRKDKLKRLLWKLP